MKRLTESPESIRLGKIVLDYDDARAIAFAVIGNAVAWSTSRTHPWIFNAVKAGVSAREAKEDYGVQFSPALTTKDRKRFAEVYTGEMGALREGTHAGRAWREVKAPNGSLSAVSFWSMKAETPREIVDKVVKTLYLDRAGNVFVEYIDSRKPVLWQGTEEEEKTRPLASKLFPDLSAKQIIDILVRAHTTPGGLKAWEKKVVDEFRGKKDASLPTLGFDTAAERKFFATIGDSQQKIARAQKIIEGLR